MLLLIFARLPITAIGACSVVCRQWRTVGDTPSLWQAACKDAFRLTPQATNDSLLAKFYNSSWKTMFLERPHLRFDGVYVARNSYIRQGATEWKVRNPVHLVAYYRYCRFFPDGTFLYRTTPEVVGKVVKTLMQKPTAGISSKKSFNSSLSGTMVHYGRYKIENDKLYTAIQYQNSTVTEVRSKMKIRSTVRGANNRLDIDSIVSYDREDGSIVPMVLGNPGEEDEGEENGVEQRRYTRGMAPYVFIPFDACQTHVLNLPVEQMDVWIPG